MNNVLSGISLGRKGLWTMTALAVYFIIVTVIVTFERFSLMNSVNEMDALHRQEERQISTEWTMTRLIGAVNENYFSPDINAAAQVLAVEIESVLPVIIKLASDYPVLNDDVETLQRYDLLLLHAPSRTVIAELRSALHLLVSDMNAVTQDIRNRKQHLMTSYRETYNRITIEWLTLVTSGVVIFGGIGMMFFRNLSRDVNIVHERAIDIVRGYRGDSLSITRGDEIGALMGAVNVMQKELRNRETQLELGRQQQFHKEKMAAVGSLAAAVAHEINNPLSAIVGIAESIGDQKVGRKCKESGGTCQPELILEQARRVMSITRQISEFSVPQSMDPELTDLNSLVRSTCSFVSFDRRLKNVRMTQQLDPQLPAVVAVADHLVQVLMNVLINAADAIHDTGRPDGEIRISTAVTHGQIELKVVDNGTGIPEEIQEKVFAEHFTTKPPGRGSGLGLAVCRSLVEAGGGEIKLHSTSGAGTEVIVSLPQTGGMT